MKYVIQPGDGGFFVVISTEDGTELGRDGPIASKFAAMGRREALRNAGFVPAVAAVEKPKPAPAEAKVEEPVEPVDPAPAKPAAKAKAAPKGKKKEG